MPTKRLKRILVVALVLVAATLAWTMLAQANATDDGHAAAIRGAGTSLVRGGTGSPSFTPVMTKFGFNWRDGTGGFECLALVPSVAAGKPGSGNFDTNAMYVTGSLTSAQVRGQTAVLQGTATVTGLGAGTNAPFTATVTRGGPGATLVLEVSGLTFNEIVLEGEIRF
jgi:uncharacterized protein with beta-barrel porin domain